MKMKKLLSIGALALTITTCTSISTFAAEAKGDKKEAVKTIAMFALKGDNVVKNLNINGKTALNIYVKPALIEKVKECITNGITDESLQKEVIDKIESGYKNNEGINEILDSLISINNSDHKDITTDATFNAAKQAMEAILSEFEKAYNNGNLDATIKKYFKVEALGGKLTYGKNSNNRLVVTLEKNGQVILQVSSENVESLQNEIKNRIHSWSDLKNYFSKVNVQ